jgi:hypothetical protein
MFFACVTSLFSNSLCMRKGACRTAYELFTRLPEGEKIVCVRPRKMHALVFSTSHLINKTSANASGIKYVWLRSVSKRRPIIRFTTS